MNAGSNVALTAVEKRRQRTIDLRREATKAIFCLNNFLGGLCEVGSRQRMCLFTIPTHKIVLCLLLVYKEISWLSLALLDRLQYRSGLRDIRQLPQLPNHEPQAKHTDPSFPRDSFTVPSGKTVGSLVGPADVILD